MPGIDETESEFRYRINDPNKYKRFRYGKDKFGEGVSVVWGITDEGKVEVQALRFSKDKFKNKDAVRKWIKEHKKNIKEWKAFIESFLDGRTWI